MSRCSDILEALIARLAEITQADGYSCDAGFNVFRNLEYQSAPPVWPSLALFPGDVNDTLGGDVPPSQGEENHLLPIEINGFCDDNAGGEKSELLRQDILRALKRDPYFGGLTEGFSGSIVSGAQVQPRIKQTDDGEVDEGFEGMCKVVVTIFFVTLYGEE